VSHPSDSPPRLHLRFRALGRSLPRLTLCELPTPVRPLEGLREGLWLKDDSRSGPLFGGNKPRKLEWVLADARRRRRRTVLTFGALGTNHGLATALYAREHGLRCAVALTDQPVDVLVERQLARLRASGATLHHTHTKARTVAAVPWLLARHRLPYPLPPGGSSPLGAVGFVEAALELADQVRAGALPEPEEVWCALGSGGTAAGLAVGLELAGLRSAVCAVHVNDGLRLDERTVGRLARRTAALLRRRGAEGVPDPAPGRLRIVHGFLGAGYGHATPQAADAIAAAREAEGLALDPVYTGKAMAGVLDRAAAPAVFWNSFNAVAPPAPRAPAGGDPSA
jgi:D-cysteine desulfhydrase